MELLITYSIKASLAMALFYCLHMLLFRNETFFKLRRAYFLFALVFSLLFPFISISWSASSTSALPTAAYMLAEIEVFVDGQVQGSASGNGLESLSLFQVLVGIASLGALFLCGRFVVQLTKLVFHLRSIEAKEIDGYRIIEIDNGKCSSFSFFRWIVINSTEQTASQIEDIAKHESVHASQWHSVDVLLYEAFCVLFWWNPFAWMMKNEMKLNLEYLADAGTLQAKDNYKDYQYTLLKISTANSGMAFINNFNILHLKKRITMMNKKRSSIARSAKFLLVAPLTLALLLGNVAHATPSIIMEIDEVAEVAQTPKKTEKIYDVAEVMPEFPGGEKQMMDYISKNLIYPKMAQDGGVQGGVVIRFTIQSDGSLKDVKVAEKNKAEENDNSVVVVAACDGQDDEKTTRGALIKLMHAEAIKAVETMPKWTPAKNKDGEAVAVYFNLPIVFKLTPTKEKSE